MLRPVHINSVFNLSVDVYTTLLAGLCVPKLCLEQVKTQLKDYKALVSLTSSVHDDVHIDKENYFNILMSAQRTQDITNAGFSMVIVFTFENLKAHKIFNSIKDEPIIVFFRHLRNASAHGNRFHFNNGKRIIDPGSIIWRGKTIDLSLQDQIAFPNFFGHGDLAYLLEDISLLLREKYNTY